MGRCRCDEFSAAGCQCSIEDTNSIDAQGAGSASNPFNFHVKRDTDPENQLEETSLGLFVPAPQQPITAWAAADPSGVLLTVTDTYEDVPDMEVELDVPDATTVFVLGMLTMNPAEGVTALLQGRLDVDGTPISAPLIEKSTHGDGGRSSVTAMWEVAVGAGTHVFKLQAARNNAFAGGGDVQAGAIYARAF